MEYISTSAPNTAFRTSEPLQHDFFQYDTAFASQGSGDFLSEFDASSSSFTNPQAESPFNPPLVTFQAPTPPDAGSLGTWNSLYNLNRPRDLERVSPFQPFHENISDVHNMHNNHQASDLRHNPDADSTEPRKRSATPVTPTDSLNQEVETSPTSMISGEPKDSDRGGSETPRNERNQLTCIHVDCASNAPIFLRRCEWR